MSGGERFGRYQLIKLVGEGGMAQVHLARQVGPQGFVKPCVLKRISSEHRGDAKVRRMFLEEARLSAILNHPHIVQTFDFGEVDGQPFLAMELVDGVNLSQLLRTLAGKQRWIPLRAAIEICIAVADALDYAHHLKDLDSGRELHLVHRDVSPQNILLSRQGGLKLADFGIARHDARDERTIGVASRGKPGYMAPEQSISSEIDARADLFSLGIVLTELVSARRMLKTPGALLALDKRVRELFALRDDVPPGLLDIALSMTKVEPGERAKNAKEVVHGLRKLLGKLDEKHSLQNFLEKVFPRYFPSDLLTVAEGSGPSQPANVAYEDSDPLEGEKTLVDRAEWAPKEAEAPENPVAAIYGWPEEYVAKDPKLELVARSSTMDSMKYFGAQNVASLEPPAPPVFGPSGTPIPAPRAPEVPHIPKVLLGTLLESDEQKKARERRDQLLKTYLPLVGAGLVFALLAFGVTAFFNRSPEKSRELVAESGAITVASVPPGARVIINGTDSKLVTPVTIDQLALGQPVRVMVRMDGFVSVPAEAMITIPEGEKKTNAYFTLKRGRVFRVETTPEGATIELNGRVMSASTPMTLPAIPLGESATIAVSLPGYIAAKVVLESNAATATVTALALELGKEVDMTSEPPGARVFVDNLELGLTPLYDVLIPTTRKFRVRIDKKGYKSWKQTMSAKAIKGRTLEAELNPLPLLAMPMSKEERAEAKEWDRKMSRLSGALKHAKAKLRAAEKKLTEVESSPTIFIGKIADAQRAADEWRSKVEELDTEITDVDVQLQIFRERVMAKLEE